jgi:hypothetical protein
MEVALDKIEIAFLTGLVSGVGMTLLCYMIVSSTW